MLQDFAETDMQIRLRMYKNVQ